MTAIAGVSRFNRPMNQAERELRKFLATIAYPWQIERGSKHDKVLIAGTSVGVICHNKGKGNDAKQIIASVKQRIRQLEYLDMVAADLVALPFQVLRS